MKKLLALMLTLVLMFTLAACGKKNTPAPAQPTPVTQATPTTTPAPVEKEPAAPAANTEPEPTSEPASTPTTTVEATDAPTTPPAEPAAPEKSEAGNTGATSKSNFPPMQFGYITINVPDGFGEVEDWGMYNSMGPNWSTIDVSHGEPVNLRPEEYTKEGMKEMLGDMLKDFKGEINLNGNKAVYYTMQMETESGKSFTRHLVWLYNADITAQYSIGLEYTTGDAVFTSDVVNQIINSITLAPEAQHLGPEFEG